MGGKFDRLIMNANLKETFSFLVLSVFLIYSCLSNIACKEFSDTNGNMSSKSTNNSLPILIDGVGYSFIRGRLLDAVYQAMDKLDKQIIDGETKKLHGDIMGWFKKGNQIYGWEEGLLFIFKGDKYYFIKCRELEVLAKRCNVVCPNGIVDTAVFRKVATPLESIKK